MILGLTRRDILAPIPWRPNGVPEEGKGKRNESLGCVQTDATLLDVTCCVCLHTLLHVVGCGCVLLRKVWNRSNFSANNFQHVFCSKRSATMLDQFAQLFQHCWSRARSLRMFYKDLWVVSLPRCTAGSNIVGSCCIRLHATANTHATTPNIVGATMLGVVASVRLHATANTHAATPKNVAATMLGVVASVRLHAA